MNSNTDTPTSNLTRDTPLTDAPYFMKISVQGHPLSIAKRVCHQLLQAKDEEVELAAVGNAITNLLLTSSILAEYLEYLHRLNTFAFKPCEYCTANDKQLDS